MRIAVATENGSVAEHFGRCRSYTLVDIKDGEVGERRTVDNPGHEPGRIPRFLKEHGADVVIAGGMGRRAQQLFDQMGIEWVLGVTGSVEDAVESCRAGALEGGDSLCSHGEGHGDGHGHAHDHEAPGRGAAGPDVRGSGGFGPGPGPGGSGSGGFGPGKQGQGGFGRGR
jgi:predicted Fe-Mo cluster-binding NifX family protein